MHCTQETLFIQNNPSSRWRHLSLGGGGGPETQGFFFWERLDQKIIKKVSGLDNDRFFYSAIGSRKN